MRQALLAVLLLLAPASTHRAMAVTPVTQTIIVLAAYRQGGVPYWPSSTATIANVQADNVRQMSVWEKSSYGDYKLVPQSYGWYIVPRMINGKDACSQMQLYGEEVERQARLAGMVPPDGARIAIQHDCGHIQGLYLSSLGTWAPSTDGKAFNNLWCQVIGLPWVYSNDAPLVGSNHFDTTTPCGQTTPYGGSANGNERWRKGWLLAPQFVIDSGTPTAPETKFIEALELPRGTNLKYWRFGIGAVNVRSGGAKQLPAVHVYQFDRLQDLDPVNPCRFYPLPVGQTYIMLDQSSGVGDKYLGIRNEGFSADLTGARITVFPTSYTPNTIRCPGVSK